MSHPIGPTTDFSEIILHRDNLTNAHAWFKLLVSSTRWALMAPWLAYLTAVGNNMYGPRALADQIMLLERCDLLVQVGGSTSPHMVIEANHAARRGMPIVDLTDLGTVPLREDRVRAEIAVRTKHLLGTPRRRVWLPPLEEHDIDALRAAELVLQADPFSEDARGVIQRIVTAAMMR